MNERERRILTDLVDAVCELGAEVDELENQLVIRTKERDELDRWQNEHLFAIERISRLEGVIKNHQHWEEKRGAENDKAFKLLRRVGEIIGAVNEDEVVDVAQRAMQTLAAMTADRDRLYGERDQLASELYAERERVRSPESQRNIDILNSIMSETFDVLGEEGAAGGLANAAKRVVEERDRAIEEKNQLAGDLDGAKYFEDLVKKVHDILGWDNMVEGLEDAARRVTDERDGLKNSLESYRHRGADRVEHYETIVKNAHDILGWGHPLESLKDAADRIVDKLASLENQSPQTECRRLRKMISDAHDALGRVSTEGVVADTKRVVAERDRAVAALESMTAGRNRILKERDNLAEECQSATKRLMEELKSVAGILSGTYGNEDSAANEARKVMRHVAGLNKVADAALAVWKVYGRPVRTGDEEDRIARSNALDDAMGLLDEALNRGMDDQEGPDATDDGDMVAVDFVQCNCFNHASTPSELCVLALGHDGPHVFPSEVGEPGEVIDAEFVRCSEEDSRGQCLDAQGHDGPHVFGRQCMHHSEEDPTGKLRCIRRQGHDDEHVF